jgi:hypothetical protein
MVDPGIGRTRLGHRTFKVRANDWDPIRAEHYGQRLHLAQTGRTHDRTRPMLQKRQKVLAKAAAQSRHRAAGFAVMHKTAQTAMLRSVEPGQGNETALQSRPRTS